MIGLITAEKSNNKRGEAEEDTTTAAVIMTSQEVDSFLFLAIPCRCILMHRNCELCADTDYRTDYLNTLPGMFLTMSVTTTN